jgi:hypothetical protein
MTTRAMRPDGNVLRTSQSPRPSERQSGIPIGQPTCTCIRSKPDDMTFGSIEAHEPVAHRLSAGHRLEENQ